jgi:hypothetical protein
MQVDGNLPNHQEDCDQQNGTEALEVFQVRMVSWISWVGRTGFQNLTLATLHAPRLHRKVEVDAHRRLVVNACPGQSRFAVRNNCPTTL